MQIHLLLARRLGIPDTDYSATIKMPSSEFQRIVKCAASFITPGSVTGMHATALSGLLFD